MDLGNGRRRGVQVKTGRMMESHGKNLNGGRVVPASEGRVKAKDLCLLFCANQTPKLMTFSFDELWSRGMTASSDHWFGRFLATSDHSELQQMIGVIVWVRFGFPT